MANGFFFAPSLSSPVSQQGTSPLIAKLAGKILDKRNAFTIPTFTMPTEKAYELGIPETERIGQERLLRILRGEYTPAQQRYFTEGMNPVIARLAGMGALGAGGASDLLARTGAGMVMGLQERALSDLLGLGTKQREYEQWAQGMGQKRYLTEADLALKRHLDEAEMGLRKYLGELGIEAERQKAKASSSSSFWQTLGTLAGALLPHLFGGGSKTTASSTGKILEEPTYMG